MTEYLLSEEAQNDLRAILEYTRENWGGKRAKRYLAELAVRFEQLARSPGLGKTRDEIGAGIRSFRAGRHIVFYRETPSGIEIARVLHPSMDLRGHLEPH